MCHLCQCALAKIYECNGAGLEVTGCNPMCNLGAYVNKHEVTMYNSTSRSSAQQLARKTRQCAPKSWEELGERLASTNSVMSRPDTGIDVRPRELRLNPTILHPHPVSTFRHTNHITCMEHRRPRDALSCDRCRAKKLKCSKDLPICTSCAHSGSQCHYSGKVARSPLTRAYLTGVEKRLHSLENLVTQLVPGVDVDHLLASPSLAAKSPPKIRPRSPEVAPSPEGSTKSISTEPALPEAVPNNVDGFNWHEENVNVDGLTDGMAALSVEPTGVGYLG